MRPLVFTLVFLPFYLLTISVNAGAPAGQALSQDQGVVAGVAGDKLQAGTFASF